MVLTKPSGLKNCLQTVLSRTTQVTTAIKEPLELFLKINSSLKTMGYTVLLCGKKLPYAAIICNLVL